MATSVGDMDQWLRADFLKEMVKNLPNAVQDRVVVLKNDNLEMLNLESKLREEILELDIKYQQKFQTLEELRKLIVTGELDPPIVLPNYNADGEFPNELVQQEFAALLKEYKDYPADTKGVPDFWLTIFRNTETLNDLMGERDDELLKKLTDISIQYGDDYSYTLLFHFDKNDYFTNEVLTKQYFLQTQVDAADPFNYDGPVIYKCKGCTINWKEDMNVTVKTVLVKRKNKLRGTVRMVAKHVAVDSFFKFFSPPEYPENEAEMDAETEKLFMDDFVVGQFFQNRIIPQAILYYTGIIFDD